MNRAAIEAIGTNKQQVKFLNPGIMEITETPKAQTNAGKYLFDVITLFFKIVN